MSDVILSLDPSSSCLGWATLRAGRLYLASGRILPKSVKTRKGYEVYGRIESICQQLVALLEREQPTVIVVELTSGNRARRLGQNVSHLSIYGAAVGAVWREAESWAREFVREHRSPCEVTGFLENEWTGQKPKAERIATAALMFQQYQPANDSGGDEADALMLNVWYQQAARMKEAIGEVEVKRLER